METVYIVAIVAIAVTIVIVVWLLRDRITGGRVEVSSQKLEADVQAVPPSQPPAGQKGTGVEISGNWLIGRNVIRVLRHSVRVARNRLLGKNRIDVSEARPTPEKDRKPQQ